MELNIARELAEKWVRHLEPACERIEIAGSVRRQKPVCHDIDIVAVPKILHPKDMFGWETGDTDALELRLEAYQRHGDFEFLKDGPRFKQLALPEDIHLELWLVRPPAQWGVLFTIRTGPAEFGHWMVTQRDRGGALPEDCIVKDGAVWKLAGSPSIAAPLIDAKVPIQEEADFFTLCGMEWIEPSKRQPMWRKQTA